MGVLRNLFAKTSDSYSMDEYYDAVFRRSILGGSHAGVMVNEGSAMRFVTVFSCVRVLSEALASLPLYVYKTRPSGGADKATDHPLYDMLEAQPNDEMNTVTWREQQMANLVISGNCYSILTFNGAGRVVDVYPVPWERCWPYRDPEDGKIRYRVDDRGKFEIFPAYKVLHIPGLSWDGIMGYSPISMAAESIGIGIAAAEFSARFFSQGMNAGGTIEYPTELSQEAYDRLKEDVEYNWGGMRNAWRPIILEDGAKFNRIAMPMKDAQFIEQRQFARDEICGLFRVPPHMIANLDRATFSNIEQMSLEFVMYSLFPYIRKWEQAINWKMFTRRERQQGYYVKFDLNALLRADYESRQNGLAIQRQNGIISADEWRQEEGRNPVGGDAGEALLVNGNMIPASTAAHRTASPQPNPTPTSGEGGDNS